MARFPRWKRVIIGCAAVSAVLGLILLEENARGVIQLKRYRNRLVAAGEKLTPRELAPTISAEQEANAAALDGAGETLGKLLKECPLIESFPALLEFTEPGTARVMFNEAEPKLSFPLRSRDTQVQTWEELQRQLDVGRAALEAAKAALKKPVAYKIEYDKAVGAIIPGSGSHRVQIWLRAELLWHLHANDLGGVMEDLEALAALPRSLANARTLVGQTLRYGFAAFSCEMVWAAFQAEGWTEDQLAAVQSRFENADYAVPLVRAMEMERAMLPKIFRMLRESAPGRATLLRTQDVSFIRIMTEDDYEPPQHSEAAIWLRATLWRLAWSSQDEARSLRAWQPQIEAARALAADRNWAASPMRIPPPEKPLSGLDAWRFTFGECIGFSAAAQNVVQATVRVETYRELLRTALALKRHRLRHGTFPEKLDALVPEFLQAEPHDWMDGQPLKYRKREDGSYLLYSVGLDGIDDGGDPRPEKPKKRPQFGNGRDIVWPLLATASP